MLVRNIFTTIKSKKKMLFSAVSVFVIAMLAFLFFSQEKIVTAAWWNESWGYRIGIEVTNNVSAQSNVYVSITGNTASSFQSDCGDARFVNSEGIILPYYIVSGCGGVATFHVFFENFPSGKQMIYIYYGNQSAEN